MAIHFSSSVVTTPFAFDSIGCDWIQDKTSRPKGYPLYHYLQTEKGQGILRIKGEKYVLSEGEGILIAPFLSHSYEKTTKQWTTAFITFTGTVESSFPKLLGNRSLIFTNKNQGTKLGALIRDVLIKYDSLPVDSNSLSVDCYRLFMMFVNDSDMSSLSSEPLYTAYVAPVMKEIETHYDRMLTAAELSNMVFITPQYLSRLFKRFVGCSTYEYLLRFRISKAKELLMLHPALEIQQIAGRVGFQDASHFIAVFKKVTGLTPYEFKKIN